MEQRQIQPQVSGALVPPEPRNRHPDTEVVSSMQLLCTECNFHDLPPLRFEPRND